MIHMGKYINLLPKVASIMDLGRRREFSVSSLNTQTFPYSSPFQSGSPPYCTDSTL